MQGDVRPSFGLDAALAKDGYTLVISEKGDVAEKIALAVANGRPTKGFISGIPVFAVSNQDNRYIICAARGHLYGVADPGEKRSIFPVLDLEWRSLDRISKNAGDARKRIDVIGKLAKGATSFVNACDLDLEGETIAANILKYACGGAETRSLRAKFSTLTTENLTSALRDARPQLNSRLAAAGRTRHLIDFIYGINLSRALSMAVYAVRPMKGALSIGRVQGPTLARVVDREVEIMSFVPTPYWSISLDLTNDTGVHIKARYLSGTVDREARAHEIVNKCRKQEATITRIKKYASQLSPPVPFNTGDLQREAYRVFGYSPSETLHLAERLYLNALISYPRTGSQKLPSSLDYRKIVTQLGKISSYATMVKWLLAGQLVPHCGPQGDPAHPAIYPTGEIPRKTLHEREAKIFDLIVSRFMAIFGKTALQETIEAVFSVGVHDFVANGSRTIRLGWVVYYRRYLKLQETLLPPLSEGEVMNVKTVHKVEKFQHHPSRYTQSSLLAAMEVDGIGTQATRSEIIRTLYERQYLAEKAMVPSEMALAVVNLMRTHSPGILSVEMTQKMEKSVEDIRQGRVNPKSVIEDAIDYLLPSMEQMHRAQRTLGKELARAMSETVSSKNSLGVCPLCKNDSLFIVRSKKTGKRFVGCKNYSKGCSASAPLPQRGSIIPLKRCCKQCGWPIMRAWRRRRPWVFCVNISCSSKVDEGTTNLSSPRLSMAKRR